MCGRQVFNSRFNGRRISALFWATASLLSAQIATAATTTIGLPYLNSPFTSNTSATFSGNGFVTAITGGGYYNGFAIDNAHSYFQADISALAGETITNATVSFKIPGVVDTNVLITSFASTGTLAFYILPPNTISSQVVTVNGGGVSGGGTNGTLNTLNITSMVQERVAGSHQYFALHMNGSTNNLWTDTPSSAQLTLVITTADPCGNSTIGSGEDCDDGGTINGDCCSSTCQFEPNGSACGSTGDTDCDDPDTCDGAGTCDANYEPSTTVCRSDDGQCDVTENCTGSSATCPADSFESASVLCSGASQTGACDNDTADHCSGSGNVCVDVYHAGSVVCRADVGQCDVVENCSGSSAACPADGFESAAAACTGSSQAGACDNDAAEHCSGSGNVCVDIYQAGTVVCRADAGQCDVTENCTGSSAACPADLFESSSAPCSGAAQGGVCNTDASDHCSGSGNVCVDTYQSSALVCRPVAGVCDVAESCTGSSGTCPTEAFVSSAMVCRTDSGECDVPENCTGAAAACPADAFESTGTACGSSLDDQCTNPDTCNGANNCLPNHEPFGVICDDGRICTIDDACDGGGECDANSILFKENCTYFSTGERENGSILGHIGNNGALTGDLCFDHTKVFAFTDVTGSVVAAADTGSKGHRFGEGAAVSGAIVTDGSGVFAIKGALLPHLTPGATALAGGTVQAKDMPPGGIYDLSGTHALVANCQTARGDLLEAADTIEALASTQSHGDTKLGSGDTLTLTPTVVGGVNVIDYARIRGGDEVTINVSGGGDADTVMIVRVGKRFQLRDNSAIQMTDGMQSKNFVLYVARSRTDIGNFSTVAGTIYGRGFVRIGEEAILDGQIFGSGGKVEINSGVVGTLVPNEIVLP